MRELRVPLFTELAGLDPGKPSRQPPTSSSPILQCVMVCLSYLGEARGAFASTEKLTRFIIVALTVPKDAVDPFASFPESSGQAMPCS